MSQTSGRSRTSETRRKKAPPLAAVVLAAGEGKRMKSRLPKVLHQVAGRPIVEHVVLAAAEAGAEPTVVVVGFGGEAVEASLLARLPDRHLLFTTQPDQHGTADAVSRARDHLRGFRGDVLILCGDVPALPAAALRALVRHHRRKRAALTVLTAELADPTGYGRIIRSGDGRITEIVEHKDATTDQRRVREINTGTYCVRWEVLAETLDLIEPNNAQGEYYLTDAVRLLLERGERAEACLHSRPEEAMGINSRRHLAEVNRVMNQQTLSRLMNAGVTVLDPRSTWVQAGVKVGRDTVLHPGVTLEGETRLGAGCTVRGGCRLTNVVAGEGVTILEGTIAEDARIGRDTKLGPYAHLRPGTDLGPECKVGNFVETKKARFGRGSKASHLSYLGDTVLGKNVNIGAGTITCNYDGVHKHRTEFGDGVFIGSDTQLVAPVKVGQGAYVGAGSTITKSVPPGALALTRVEQRNIEGWVARKKKKEGKERGRKPRAKS